MNEAGIDALLLAPTTDLRYLTGFSGHQSDRLTCFLLTAEEAFLLYPNFEKAGINAELADMAECRAHIDGNDPFAILASFIKDKIGRKADGPIAVDNLMWSGNLLALQERLPKSRWLGASTILSPLRMLKDDEEYSLLKKAQVLAGQALGDFFKWGLEGRTEREAATQLTEFCTRVGLGRADWGPIVASGANGASPHHGASDKIIAKGDPVVIDFGGVYCGYQADMTRTPVIGPASDEFKEIHEIVLRANEAAFRAPRPALPCEAVDAAARTVIQQAGYGEFFTHRLGHGIGLDIHEDPYLVKGNTLPIAAGMSFSDEPGIYLPGKFGIRIEDILFMKDTGAERLTEFPHDLREL